MKMENDLNQNNGKKAMWFGDDGGFSAQSNDYINSLNVMKSKITEFIEMNCRRPETICKRNKVKTISPPQTHTHRERSRDTPTN